MCTHLCNQRNLLLVPDELTEFNPQLRLADIEGF
jgi:hypothetical protein